KGRSTRGGSDNQTKRTRRGHRMGSKQRRNLLPAVLLVVLAVVIAGCGGQAAAPEQPGTQTESPGASGGSTASRQPTELVMLYVNDITGLDIQDAGGISSGILLGMNAFDRLLELEWEGFSPRLAT